MQIESNIMTKTRYADQFGRSLFREIRPPNRTHRPLILDWPAGAIVSRQELSSSEHHAQKLDCPFNQPTTGARAVALSPLHSRPPTSRTRALDTRTSARNLAISCSISALLANLRMQTTRDTLLASKSYPRCSQLSPEPERIKLGRQVSASDQSTQGIHLSCGRQRVSREST